VPSSNAPSLFTSSYSASLFRVFMSTRVTGNRRLQLEPEIRGSIPLTFPGLQSSFLTFHRVSDGLFSSLHVFQQTSLHSLIRENVLPISSLLLISLTVALNEHDVRSCFVYCFGNASVTFHSVETS
jgi:hypothetical protein